MKLLIGFGASTMQGAGDPEGGFLQRVARQLEGAGAGWKVVNLGIGGDTTREMLARAGQVQTAGRGEHEVVVLLGCNDVPRAKDSSPQRRTEIAEYRNNLVRILEQVKGKRSLFVSSFRVSAERTGVETETLRQYMAVAMEVAAAQGYEVWDLFAETFEDGVRYWAEDGMHYNGVGHQFIAERVVKWAREQG